MSERLLVPPRPCSTCPYRKDTPPGIWAPKEYRKLADYDRNPGPYAIFHCHQENITKVDTICRGWLAVHPDCVAVRIALAHDLITPEERDAPVEGVELYPSGKAAMRAGMRGVLNPPPEARRQIEKLDRRLRAKS